MKGNLSGFIIQLFDPETKGNYSWCNQPTVPQAWIQSVINEGGGTYVSQTQDPDTYNFSLAEAVTDPGNVATPANLPINPSNPQTATPISAWDNDTNAPALIYPSQFQNDYSPQLIYNVFQQGGFWLMRALYCLVNPLWAGDYNDFTAISSGTIVPANWVWSVRVEITQAGPSVNNWWGLNQSGKFGLIAPCMAYEDDAGPYYGTPQFINFYKQTFHFPRDI